MKKEITILTSWKGEIYEIDWNIKAYINMKTQAKQNWEDWFWSEKYQTFIKFASLEKEQGKTNYLTIEAPNQTIEPTQEEIKIKADFLRDIHKKTYDTRKKKFIEKRKQILSDLAKKELEYELETTESKLEEYNLLKTKSKLWK